MTILFRSRRGMALPIAIGAIVLIGMLVGGVFFVVTQESRMGKSAATQEAAFRVAEYGLNTVAAKWDAAGLNGMANGKDSVVLASDSSSINGQTDTVHVTRLNSNAYLITSAATMGSGNNVQGRRQTSLMVKLNRPTFNFIGALTVRGALQVGGSSNINGNDTAPGGWSCPPAQAALAGVATNSGSNITLSGCSNYSCIAGSPKVDTTAVAADTSTYFSYGDANWNSLVSMANINFATGGTFNGIGPVVTNGVCDKTNTKNWGDPNRATPSGVCESYFPIIHFGDTLSNVQITGGTGQGILLIDGDLTVSGGFTFYGPVIVRGHLRTTGTGGHFNGGVMAANVDLEQNAVLGNAIINYSSCAVQTAVLGVSGIVSAKDRGWVEMFSSY